MKEAHYTEYLTEYLKNNALPEIFSEIDGFSDLFVANFCNREIGFETEILFKIKLEAKANVIIPLYKQRLIDYDLAHEKAKTAKKSVQETVTGNYGESVNFGNQKSKTTDLPLDETSALPSSVTENEAFMNTSDRDESRELSRYESGETTLEAYEVIERLKTDVFNIKRLLLLEFDPLFMGVF